MDLNVFILGGHEVTGDGEVSQWERSRRRRPKIRMMSPHQRIASDRCTEYVVAGTLILVDVP